MGDRERKKGNAVEGNRKLPWEFHPYFPLLILSFFFYSSLSMVVHNNLTTTAATTTGRERREPEKKIMMVMKVGNNENTANILSPPKDNLSFSTSFPKIVWERKGRK